MKYLKYTLYILVGIIGIIFLVPHLKKNLKIVLTYPEKLLELKVQQTNEENIMSIENLLERKEQALKMRQKSTLRTIEEELLDIDENDCDYVEDRLDYILTVLCDHFSVDIVE